MYLLMVDGRKGELRVLFLLHGFTGDSETCQAKGKTTLTDGMPGAFTSSMAPVSLTVYSKVWTR